MLHEHCFSKALRALGTDDSTGQLRNLWSDQEISEVPKSYKRYASAQRMAGLEDASTISLAPQIGRGRAEAQHPSQTSRLVHDAAEVLLPLSQADWKSKLAKVHRAHPVCKSPCTADNDTHTVTEFLQGTLLRVLWKIGKGWGCVQMCSAFLCHAFCRLRHFRWIPTPFPTWTQGKHAHSWNWRLPKACYS